MVPVQRRFLVIIHGFAIPAGRTLRAMEPPCAGVGLGMPGHSSGGRTTPVCDVMRV
jgi:hypothetical protein